MSFGKKTMAGFGHEREVELSMCKSRKTSVSNLNPSVINEGCVCNKLLTSNLMLNLIYFYPFCKQYFYASIIFPQSCSNIVESANEAKLFRAVVGERRREEKGIDAISHDAIFQVPPVLSSGELVR